MTEQGFAVKRPSRGNSPAVRAPLLGPRGLDLAPWPPTPGAAQDGSCANSVWLKNASWGYAIVEGTDHSKQSKQGFHLLEQVFVLICSERSGGIVSLLGKTLIDLTLKLEGNRFCG